MVVQKKIENILVLGKSGAGKQPRVDVLMDVFGLEQLSTGDIFRHYLGVVNDCGFGPDFNPVWDKKNNCYFDDATIKRSIQKECCCSIDDLDDLVLGMKARYFVENGKYVPDNITNSLFDRFFSMSNYRGKVIDGYPRSMAQAEYLLQLAQEKSFTIDLCVVVDNSDEQIMKRLLGRRICPNCRKVFHVEFRPPRKGKYCTVCGTPVVLRSDDTKEKIMARLREFYEKTLPIMDYMRGRGLLFVTVPGHLDNFTPENVKKSVMVSINKILQPPFH